MRTLINIKTEQEVKNKAQKLAGQLGLSLSAIINAYLKQFVRNKAVNFSITPRMSEGLENLLGKVEFDIRRNRNLSNAISSDKKLKVYFDAL